MPAASPSLEPAPLATGSTQGVDSDLIDALYKNLPVSQVSATLVAAVFAVFFWDNTAHAFTLLWLVYMVTVAGSRLWLGRLYKKAPERRTCKGWDDRFFVGVLAAGLGWLAAGVMFFDPMHVTEQVLLLGSLAGVTAGSIAHLSPSLRSAYTFLILGLTPVVYDYLVHPEAGVGMAVLAALFLLMMMFVARRAHNYTRANAVLLHGHRHLVDKLMGYAQATEEAKAQDEAEREMAVSVFKSIMPVTALAADNVTYHLSSHSAFNGDVLLIETRPDGRQNVMLGDFTGHGLAASLGAIPVADIFVSMTRKGFPLNVIVSEINRKLHHHLPRNLFCAACLAEIDAGRSRVRVWNGGLPSVYLLHGDDGTIRRQVEASHPPLGILPPGAFDDRIETIKIAERDQLFMATDGVIEQRDADGEMFGERRLERILNTTLDIKDLTKVLKEELDAFCADVGQSDDVTFVAMRAERLSAPVVGAEQPAAEASQQSLSEPAWSLRVVLQPEALRNINPVPVLNHLIQEFNGSSDDLMQLELVLGELYKNALDHGVLGLDSGQKESPDGFEAYYARRDAQLEGLQSGSVAIDIVSHPDETGGTIELEISDTGEGFDHQALAHRMRQDLEAHGRGVPLVQALCRRLEYVGKGNHAKAQFRWKASGG